MEDFEEESANGASFQEFKDLDKARLSLEKTIVSMNLLVHVSWKPFSRFAKTFKMYLAP